MCCSQQDTEFNSETDPVEVEQMEVNRMKYGFSPAESETTSCSSDLQNKRHIKKNLILNPHVSLDSCSVYSLASTLVLFLFRTLWSPFVY